MIESPEKKRKKRKERRVEQLNPPSIYIKGIQESEKKEKKKSLRYNF
jgi:hypothetical protein